MQVKHKKTKTSRGTPSSKIHIKKTRISTRYLLSDDFAKNPSLLSLVLRCLQ